MQNKRKYELKEGQNSSDEKQAIQSRPKRARKAPKTADDYTSDYRPGMDSNKNQDPIVPNVPKRKRQTKTRPATSKRAALAHDSHVGESNDHNHSPFRADSEEYYFSGFTTSEDEREDKTSPSRRNNNSSAAKRKKTSPNVEPPHGKSRGSKPAAAKWTVPDNVPRKKRAASSRQRTLTQYAESPPRNPRRVYNVIVAEWGFYSDEESDQDVVPLRNKRFERSQLQVMLKKVKEENMETMDSQTPTCSVDAHESSTPKNPEWDLLVIDLDSPTPKQDVSSPGPWERPVKLENGVCVSEPQRPRQLPPPSSRETKNESEALVHAVHVSKFPADATASAHRYAEDIIDLSD